MHLAALRRSHRQCGRPASSGLFGRRRNRHCRFARNWPTAPTITSAVGYSLDYNTLDNNKNPTDGLLIDFKQDFAGVGGDVTYLKSAVDGKYYAPLVGDVVGLIHLQGGILNQVGSTPLRMLDQFQMGPNLVRGFAPNGIGPRD